MAVEGEVGEFSGLEKLGRQERERGSEKMKLKRLKSGEIYGGENGRKELFVCACMGFARGWFPM